MKSYKNIENSRFRPAQPKYRVLNDISKSVKCVQTLFFIDFQNFNYFSQVLKYVSEFFARLYKGCTNYEINFNNFISLSSNIRKFLKNILTLCQR